MELTKTDMKMTKGVAILLMLLLHLFCRKDVNGLYYTFPEIHGVPLLYYFALFGDACVPMYCFASGYGLFLSLKKIPPQKKNLKRIFNLLINYWMILILFVLLGVIMGKAEIIPGTPGEFVLNFFLLSNSYNGAWWFLQTYILLILAAPFIFKILKNHNSKTILVCSGFLYLLTYVQRIKHVIDIGDNQTYYIFLNATVLVGTSQFPFILGAIFAKEKLYTKLHSMVNLFRMKNALCIMGIILLVLIHSFYESMVIAPITGITFLCLFNLIDKNLYFEKLCSFFGTHSTNIWLTHMFFYMTLFPKIIFGMKYPVIIFGLLIFLCLISSYSIKFINKQIESFIKKSVTFKTFKDWMNV